MAAPVTVNGQKTLPILWRERIPKREDVVLGKMPQPAQAAPDEPEEPDLRSASIQRDWSLGFVDTGSANRNTQMTRTLVWFLPKVPES